MTTFLIIALIILVLAILYIIGIKAEKEQSKNLSTEIGDMESDLTSGLFDIAYKNFVIKDFKSAIAILDKILTVEPYNYRALSYRASSLEALNFNLDAIEDYQKALTINNSDANIHGLLGLTYRKIGNLNEAENYLKISIEKGLKVYEIHYNILLNASEGLKNEMLRKAKNPKNLTLRNPKDFIDTQSSISENEFNEAIKNRLQDLESAISLDPENSELKKIHSFAKKFQL